MDEIKQDEATTNRVPNPEVIPGQAKRKRRNLTVNYKLEILSAADRCQKANGSLGELLRKEGLYASHLSLWRKEREQGKLIRNSKIQRGPRPKESELEEELRIFKRKYSALELKYSQAQKIIEVQKKISEILQIKHKQD